MAQDPSQNEPTSSETPKLPSEPKPPKKPNFREFMKYIFGKDDVEIPYWNTYAKIVLAMVIPLAILFAIFIEWLI